jgi:threonyl-tRNA synthetase
MATKAVKTVTAPVSTGPYPVVETGLKYAVTAEKKAKTLTIKTDDELTVVYDFLKEVKEKMTEIDTERKSIVKPINDSVKKINAMFNEPYDKLEAIEEIIKRSILFYQNEQARIQREKEAKVQAKLDRQGIDEVVVPKVVNKVAAFTGGQTRKKYTAKIIDPTKIPKEFWIIDIAALNALASVQKENFNVAGCEVEVTESLVAR